MRSAIYARISTVDQNCERQLRELREYCGSRNWTIFREYVDTNWGGAADSRPELDRLMKDAALHCFDVVLVWKLDRFGCSVRHSIQQLRALSCHGIRFIATSQDIDTKTNQMVPTGRFLLHILTAVAEFEREMIRERVKAGIDSAKHKGVKLGRPKVVFDREKVIAMRRRGLAIRAIAAKLGVSKGAVERLVRGETTVPKR